MLEKVPLHPILFALFPILTAYTSLIFYVLPDELVIPLILNLTICAIVFGISFALLRHVRRAAIVTSVSVLLIFTFDALAIVLNRTLTAMKLPTNDALYVVPYLLIAGAIISVFARSKNEFTLLTKFLNIISIVLVVCNLGYVAMHEFEIQGTLKQVRERQSKELDQIKLVSKENNPDIYYIILDAFGRTESLKEFYGYDNTEFIKQLEERGFTIAKQSKSNYQMTVLSLPSALNIEYLNYLEKIMGRDSIDNVILCRLTQKNNVTQALKRIGYRFENMRSGYAPTDYIPEADDNIGSPFGNIFHLAFARGTIIGPFQRYFDFLGNAARTVRTYAINHPDEIIAKPSPKFCFIHILIPHPPFLFHEDGSPQSLDQISLAETYTKEKYIAQIKYIQKHVLTLLDAITKDPKRKIVIVQGDHGPSLQEGTDGNPSDSFLNERMRILNAYRFPDDDASDTAPGSALKTETTGAGAGAGAGIGTGTGTGIGTGTGSKTDSKPNADGSTIYDGITPVNSFRVVFNKYFDANLPLLPDKCYFSPTATPFAFEDVTEKVKP